MKHRVKSTILALAGALLLGNAPLEDAQVLMQQGKEAEALALLEAAAAGGDAAVLANLAWLYDEGHGTPKDPARAAELYREAAAKGQGFARWRLGVMIDEGLTPGDLSEAVLLFKQAVYQGNIAAMTSLAVMYATGRGVDQDFELARMHYEMAARLGNAHAVQGLGLLYARGEGVAPDLDEAAAYWLVADQMGNEQAASYLRAMSAEFDADDRARVIARAKALSGELGLMQEESAD